MVCPYPTLRFLLTKKRIKSVSTWLDYNTDTETVSSFAPTKSPRHCLDLEPFDNLVSRVPSRTMSTNPVRTLLH